MKLFRISKTKYINDLSGIGAQLYGGRWNEKGVRVIYTSESRSLAVLEFLVHVSMINIPKDISIIQIDLPDNIKPSVINTSFLPLNWKSYPSFDILAKIGTRWLKSGKTLLLKVPSVIIENEYNFLINPTHPDFSIIKKKKAVNFNFDTRLFKRETKPVLESTQKN